ncbi:ABC transporter substrate-binding protein [Halorussus sp. MSC15.2]|uniref:ABC transporter substrate-binding protein n=1 Tax=Halorussus sp. MSC15.2 TaxID=2283638 RepID=UPI0013D733B1|nr:ABC transporter substrate-binding protein [Halorussus sp. MSC15.2]NEU57779.1 ABC transporter substrate-binding protein [Halorussus sp. MSC15.2]
MTTDGTPRVGREEKGESTGWNRRRFLGAAGATGVAGLTGPVGTVAGQNGPIKIGAVYLLSGLGQSLGSASVAAAELTVKKINEAGGIMGRDVELIVRDHENSASTANQHFRDLVQRQGVAAMIGLTSSGVTLSTAPTVAQLGVPLTLTDIGTPFITEHDEDTYGDNAQGTPVHFRTNANTAINTYAMAKYANENLDVTRVANLGPDYAYGQQCWEYFKAFSNAMGADYEYVASQFPEVGAGDMTPQINTVTNANPELVFTSFWGGDAVTFVQQATQQGLFEQATDVFDTLGADPTVFKALGNSMPEGVSYSSWYWHSTYDNENNKSFLNAWNEEYANTDTIGIPSFTGPSAWSALWMYKRAMENAGSTNPDDIASQLEGMQFQNDPRGPITIDADSHQAQAPTVIGTTSSEDDVPYDGVGLQPSQSISADRKTLTDLLSQADTNLPPGV